VSAQVGSSERLPALRRACARACWLWWYLSALCIALKADSDVLYGTICMAKGGLLFSATVHLELVKG
jgi:hypothetical protein